MTRLVFIAIAYCWIESASGSEFRNLGFDDADTSRFSSQNRGTGTPTELLPAWKITYGGDAVESIFYNDIPASGDFVTLFDQSRIHALALDFVPEGHYAVVMTFTRSRTFDLEQIGEIPQSARLLTYRSRGVIFDVSINGEELSPAVSDFPIYSSSERLVTFEVSQFAGQTVDLHLREAGLLDTNSFTDYGTGILDTLVFSVPEPKVISLASVGALVLASRRWIRRSGNSALMLVLARARASGNQDQMRLRRANQAAAGDGRTAVRFQIERDWPAAPEQRRWA